MGDDPEEFVETAQCASRVAALLILRSVRVLLKHGGGTSRSAQHDVDLVNGTVVGERNICRARQQFAVQFCQGDTARNSRRIVHLDLIGGRVIPKIDGVARPVSGDARIDGKHRATDAEPENPFQASAVKPAC